MARSTKKSPAKRSPRRTEKKPARKAAGEAPPWAILNNRGNVKQEEGDLEGAIADFTAAIELAPDEFGPRYNRGNARSLAGDLEGAVADYTDTLDIAPDFAPAWQRRGLTRQRMGDLEGAKGDLDEAVQLEPGDPTTLGERAAIRALCADFEGAIQDCEHALAVAPADWPHRTRAEHLLATIRRAEEAHLSRSDVAHAGDTRASKKKSAKKAAEMPAKKAAKKTAKTTAKTAAKKTTKKAAEMAPETTGEAVLETAPPATWIVEQILEASGFEIARVDTDADYTDYVAIVHESVVEAIVMRLSEELERLVLYVLFVPKAKKEHRAEVAEFVTRANYGMGDGNFEMDYDDGSVRFKIALDYTGEPLSALLVRNMIYDAMDTTEVYADALARVIAGKAKAKTAVRAAEKAALSEGSLA